MRRGLVVVAIAVWQLLTACGGPRASTSAPASPTIVRRCSVADLRVGLRAGGEATGDDFGTIVLRDITDTPCRLDAPVVVRPMTAAGRALPDGAAEKPAALPDPLVGGRSRQVADLAVGGEFRDDLADGGICPPDAVTIPASWQVSLGGRRWSVHNNDPHPLGGGPASVRVCRSQWLPTVAVPP